MEEQTLLRGRRKPDWLKIRLPQNGKYADVDQILKGNALNTICVSGKCPNAGECWGRGTATIMILGDICTRSCKFCAVKTGRPLLPDVNEPIKVARSIRSLQLKHVVLTSVDRDDLPDRGASFWSRTVREIKRLNPSVTIETLIPDFDGREDWVQLVIDAGHEVISHNMETVRRLTPLIRSRAKYDTSLRVIEQIASSAAVSKSGIMVGLGETFNEVVEVIEDLSSVGCEVITIGQYLQPTQSHVRVEEYVRPEVFKEWEILAKEKGFRHVESSPLVRSSYRAEKHVL
ncbi:MAG: lipoyl synthase [Bacteroidia bacterium]|nr:MAG: lipoyl synthase [Bacteroidia bacterium]